MEFLNKVELQGVVGRTDIQSYQKRVVLIFSIVTEYTHTETNGVALTEVNWWNCSKIFSEENPIIPIEKGDWAHVIGRLRQRRYTDQDGNERTINEVVVSEIEKLPR